MKSAFLSLLALTMSIPSFAEVPSPQAAQVARILLNNADIVTKLQENDSTNLVDFAVQETQHGVYQYNLVFNRQGERIPSTATVTIVEDMTPTFVDGAPKYTSSIDIKSGFGR